MKLRQLFRKIGPGVITGASDDDPSGIGTYSMAGAQFGYSLSWLTLYLYPMMTAVQEMCGRIGMVTGQGLAGVIKRHYSRPLLFLTTSLLFLANTVNVGVNLGAMAVSAQMLLNLPFLSWVLFFAVLSLVLEIFTTYKTYAKFLKWLTFSLFAYVVTAFLVNQNWLEVLKNTTVPVFRLEKEYLLMITALFGTTISPYLFFWQASEEVEEEVAEHKIISPGRGKPVVTSKDLKSLRWDTAFGMLFSQIVAFFIMITTASTLFKAGITQINTAQEAALALKPLAGDGAYLLFTLGIVGTGMLSIPVLAGSAAYGVSETFGWKEGLNKKFSRAKGFYGVIIFSTFLGLLINFAGVNPIQALFWTAVINAVISLPLLVVILLITNNEKIMGKRVNNKLSNFLGISVVLALFLMVVSYFFI